MIEDLAGCLPVSAKAGPDGHLEIGGCDTVDLAARFGTPLFVFCEETFRNQARVFKQALPGSTLFYAAKAFLCSAMCKLVEQEGLGLDVASSGELHAALQAGFPAERMILHGNNKQPSDIERAVKAGIGRVAIDNLEEIGIVASAADATGIIQKVAIRVTPGVDSHTHEYIQTGQEDSKFGLSIEGGLALEAVKLIKDQPSLTLEGLHAHIGSNIFAYDPFAKTLEILIGFLGSINRDLDIEVGEINLGGGFGIPHLESEHPLRLDVLADTIRGAVDAESKEQRIKPPQISFEPGRFLVGNAMVTLYSVGVRKQLPGIRTYISVDGGMSDNIRPSLYQARYSALLANKAMEEPGEEVTVAGMHCESGDILVKDVALPSSITRGDILAVPATGAYGYSMASNYNRQPRPAVVLTRGGEAKTIIRRETLDDLSRLEVESV